MDSTGIIWAILLPLLALIGLFFVVRRMIRTLKKTAAAAKSAKTSDQVRFAEIIYMSLICAALFLILYMAIAKILE